MVNILFSNHGVLLLGCLITYALLCILSRNEVKIVTDKYLPFFLDILTYIYRLQISSYQSGLEGYIDQRRVYMGLGYIVTDKYLYCSLTILGFFHDTVILTVGFLDNRSA